MLDYRQVALRDTNLAPQGIRDAAVSMQATIRALDETSVTPKAQLMRFLGWGPLRKVTLDAPALLVLALELHHSPPSKGSPLSYY